MELQGRLGPLLGRCAHLSRERMDARLTCYGVTPAQTHTLLYLHHHAGQADQGEIAAHLRVKPPTANGILDRMVEKGLVERSVCPQDARRRQITLTDKGACMQERLRSVIDETEAVMTAGLSEEERALLLTCLERVIENLEEDRTLC